MKRIRTAVIGAGYLGKFHLEKLASLPLSSLVSVVDIDLPLARLLAKRYDIIALKNYQSLIGKVDAVSIVTPTATHFEIAKFFLDHGAHVFVEKPITLVVEEANILISLAKAKGLVLQCGHIERFNPGFKFVRPQLSCPVFIEAQRFAPFKTRGSDISVIFDLMIHDLDIILSIVNSKITSIEAIGANVFTTLFDLANVKITFEDGCIAKLAVSRVHASSVRTLSIFQEEGCFYIDMNKNSCHISPMNSANHKDTFPFFPAALLEEISLAKTDALEEELGDYLEAIASKRLPTVSGEDARNALALAIQIYDIIARKTQLEAPLLAVG